MMASTECSARLHRIRMPTLVLVGEHDQVTGGAENKALAAGIRGAQFAVVPRGWACGSPGEPVAFNAYVRLFFSTIDVHDGSS
jgi:pimeloyl-ACP methyl ester carboxylesterase